MLIYSRRVSSSLNETNLAAGMVLFLLKPIHKYYIWLSTTMSVTLPATTTHYRANVLVTTNLGEAHETTTNHPAL